MVLNRHIENIKKVINTSTTDVKQIGKITIKKNSTVDTEECRFIAISNIVCAISCYIGYDESNKSSIDDNIFRHLRLG